jgi:hypothetical protein
MPLTTIGMAGLAEGVLEIVWMILFGLLTAGNVLAALSGKVRWPIAPTLLAGLAVILNGGICLVLTPRTLQSMSAKPPENPDFIDGDAIYWDGVFQRLTLYAIVSLIFSIVSCVRSLRTKPPAVTVEPTESV